MVPSVFTVSLDFELHWGCFEHMNLVSQEERAYFKNTRSAIIQLLSLFEQYKFHATWATVGMLFHENKEDWELFKPATLPAYNRKRVSSYEWVLENGFPEDRSPFHFAPDLIQAIIHTEGQELATHTYSHYYCLEEGQLKDDFRTDIQLAMDVAKKWGIQLSSLVFPRNQYNPDYLRIVQEAGITCVRSSPDIWYWRPATGSSFRKKFFRAADAYLPLQTIKPIAVQDLINKSKNRTLIELPASRLYRPWVRGKPASNYLKLTRIKTEMEAAAKNGIYYHLWWHPHNLAKEPNKCLSEIEEILKWHRQLNSLYGQLNLTMKESTEFIISSNVE